MWSQIDDSYLNVQYIYFEQYHNFMFLLNDLYIHTYICVCVCVIDHAAMLCNVFYNMECQRGQNTIIMEIHN